MTQLIDQYDCFVLFTRKLCVIQGHTSRMLIGAGERRDGLYYFKGIPRIHAMKINDTASLDLWHQRLGHPSLRITKLVPEVNSSNCGSSLNNICDVCQRAKQRRDKFSVSDNKTSGIFELVHCDLWGPYRTVSSCGASYFLTIVDDFSRAVWIYLLADKKEVSIMLKRFLPWLRDSLLNKSKFFEVITRLNLHV